jgi:hypothetical protein
MALQIFQFRRRKVVTVLTGLLVIPVILSLGGCGEGELFQKNNNDIQSRANYFPDPHPIETTHQNYGNGMSAMPFGTGNTGY